MHNRVAGCIISQFGGSSLRPADFFVAIESGISWELFAGGAVVWNSGTWKPSFSQAVKSLYKAYEARLTIGTSSVSSKLVSSPFVATNSRFF